MAGEKRGRTTRRPPTVERKIYFYIVEARDPEKEVDFSEFVSAIQEVKSLEFNAKGRYWDDDEGNSLCVWPDQIGVKQLQMRMGIVRRTGLPDVEKGGRLSALRLAEEAGLSEMVHAVIFEDMIAGVEFNFYGPRIGRLEGYLEEKAGLGPLSFEPILQHDAEAALARLSDIRLLSLRLKRTDASLLAATDEGGVGAGFKAALEKLDAPVVEIVLRAKKYSQDSLAQKFFDFAKGLAKKPHMRETLDTFRVKGYNMGSERVEELDLLRDAFISSKRVITQGGRRGSLRRESMYRAISESYKQLRDELREAARLQQ